MADGTSRQPETGDQGQQPPPDAGMEAQGDLQPGQVGEGGIQPVQHGDHHHGQTGHLAPMIPGQGYPVPQQAAPMHGQTGQLVPQVPGQLGYPVLQQAAPVHGQTGQLVPVVPGQGYQVPQQAVPMMYPSGQQGYGAPTAMHPYQGFRVPAQFQPTGQVPYSVPPVGPAAANTGPPPALQLSGSVGQVGGVFGGATIRIQSQALAEGVVVCAAAAAAAIAAGRVAESAAGVAGAAAAAGFMTLATFYMNKRQQTDEAIHRVVDRERHVQVEQIEEGSLLVQVKFLTLAGYWVMRSLNERIDRGNDRTCLQLLLEDELQRIGWTGPIQVGMEGWWFADAEEQEEEAGMEEEGGQEEEGEQEEERWEWAGMLEKQSPSPSMTTEGDSGVSVAAMSVSSAGEVEEGPLKWQRARLQKHKDSPTAQRYIKAFRSWEEGADILTTSGYKDMGGVKALVLGFMQLDIVPSSFTSTVLYDQSWLNLSKAQLKQLVTSQLQVDPTDSTCLLLTALQLPHGDSRVQTLQQVVAAILQHGPGDWLYQHLHHIYCELGRAIWEASPKPKPTMTSKLPMWSDLPTTNLPALAKALSAMASSLMYKQDHLTTVYLTALLSKEVSETETIRQLEHFLRLAPECDHYVPSAHYRLATLYNQQQDRQKVIHHFTRGEQREANRLPVFNDVPRFFKDPARKAYEHFLSY
ncbi:Hypp1525 [Branchiostoma lanceolatum]|uniref:Hypp1525 protein n=1 Tax=Branchiostoma lanceolatum TaxID=7740 RepID=A0A8J9ZLI3_BRALA|nr:Hypp1525 [Branchiostoma lanceolatum]